MSDSIYERESIRRIVKPIAEKYRIQNVYMFGSYARGEATYSSDLDFLVYGGEQFKRTMIFAFAEELRKALEKNVDVFEINEINENSDFYHTIMRERVLVA
jgi:predicted nucleotidyltransferase